MDIHIVEAYSGRRYLGLAISWVFTSREAAEWYIANLAGSTRGVTYVASRCPCYTLEALQNLPISQG